MYSAPGGMPPWTNYSYSQSTQPPQHGYGLQTLAQSMFQCYERETAYM